MTERLLQFIWQFQYFNKSGLQTTDAHGLDILHTGMHNTNQGPDFLNGKIKVDHTIWAGSIELHINSSDWQLHNHGSDHNYNNVILHVVWNDDRNMELPFPTLELQNRVSKLLLDKYEELMRSARFIPCEAQIGQLNEVVIISWKERMLVERLQHKTGYIESLLKQNNRHWEETFWWMIARNFGMKINGDTFEKMAQSIPINILAKHKSQINQLEALLMGQVGLLDKDFEEDYPKMLQKEYLFLKKKYKLDRIHLPVFFLRMRPANFPCLRLAQLAALIHQSEQLFPGILEAKDLEVIKKMLSVTANDYWHYHYIFDEPSGYKKKTLGEQMISNVFINTIIPMLYAYGYFTGKEDFKARAIQWMELISSENNNITKGFEQAGIKNKTAFDSQALIQLKNEYCDQRRCLQCAIGNKILQVNTGR